MSKLTPEEDRVQEAVARYAAQPEFDRRIAVELMGWMTGPSNGWYDATGTNTAGPEWSPTTDANAAVEVMRSPRWCAAYPTSVVLFGGNPRARIIVASEGPDGLTELASDNRFPMAVAIAAVRLISSTAN